MKVNFVQSIKDKVDEVINEYKPDAISSIELTDAEFKTFCDLALKADINNVLDNFSHDIRGNTALYRGVNIFKEIK